MSSGCPGMRKKRSSMNAVSNRWESIRLHPSWFQRHSSSKFWSRDFQLSKMMGVQPYISLSSCPFWYATLNSCRYLKGETHLRNAQANKASSVNNGLAKHYLVVVMIRINVCCITLGQLVLVCLELLRILT